MWKKGSYVVLPVAVPCPARGRRGGRRLAAAALVLCTTTGTLAVTSLRPASADVAAQIVVSQAQLDALNSQAEAAAERFDAGRIALASAQLAAATARAALQRQDAQLAAVRQQADGLAAQAYRTGPGQTLALWTTPSSASSIMSGLADLDAVARSQSTVLAALATARGRQQAASAAADAAAARAAASFSSLEADRTAVVTAAAQAQQVLAGLQAQQTQLAQSAKDAAARQAAQAAAAALADQARGAAASLTAFTHQPSGPESPSGPSGPYGGSGAAQGAVRTALAQLGKPYVFGAAGPNSFDCSGLTMYAYRSVGISLAHFTGAQMGEGRRVSYAELQPGDLVFFPGHVGMYIGNGQMVHAPHTGTVVQVAALAGYWQSDFIGATRPAG